MTTFKQVCLELFHQRNRYVKFFLSVQAVLVIIYSVFISISHHGVSLLTNFHNLIGWMIPYNLMIETTVYFDIVFLGLVIFKNEKWQSSQTWRLIPISDTKLFFANIVSTILNCIVIFIPQVIVLTILNGLTSFDNMETFSWNVFLKGAKSFWISSGDPKGFQMCISLAAIVLLIMTFVSFANFSSSTITNFLPVKNKRLARWSIVVVIVIIGAYLGNIVQGIINNYWERVSNRFLGSLDQMTTSQEIYLNTIQFIYPVLIILTAAIILGLLDLWLFNKYVEPSPNHV